MTDRIISVTLDNATSNNAMIRELKEKLNADDTILHQRCATHIINLIVQAGAASYDHSINKIRNYISWINSSTYRVDELKRRLRVNGL